MKKLLFVVMIIACFASCEKEETLTMTEEVTEGTIIGRWVLEGFEDNIRYEFTEEKRYAIYGQDGVFPSLEEFIAENPGVGEKDWYWEDEILVLDLNFGNIKRYRTAFKCNGQVLNLIDEADGSVGIYFREGHDLAVCD